MQWEREHQYLVIQFIEAALEQEARCSVLSGHLGGSISCPGGVLACPPEPRETVLMAPLHRAGSSLGQQKLGTYPEVASTQQDNGEWVQVPKCLDFTGCVGLCTSGCCQPLKSQSVYQHHWHCWGQERWGSQGDCRWQAEQALAHLCFRTPRMESTHSLRAASSAFPCHEQ